MEGGKEPQLSAAPRVASGGGDAPRVKRLRRRRGPGAPIAPPNPPSARARLRVRPALPHLASSSSGVSGHLAAKWAVTALDAEAVRAPSSESQSAVKPRSSRTTPAAFAMVRPGKHEPRALSPAPSARSRHATAGSSRSATAHFRWGERESVTRAGAWRAPGACVERSGAVPGAPEGGPLGHVGARRRRSAELGWCPGGSRPRDLRLSDRRCGTPGGETEVGF